ncbi:hemagglutinin repeat-containing protein [Megasphaera stantonii]|uniref:two-partner secretion domain-containing protein n=1 Tax=Megasphaera stantonii TaxID=2144175 RepID=UPI0023F5257E|nr:hemagglutinin repeat-containing protein [Megasphaera stantonii]
MKYRNRLATQVTAWLVLGLFGMDSVLAATAPILPDTNAPASRQPLVQQTANGIPLVQIAGPSAGGVSINQYSNFNVPKEGAILNNSHTVVNTQLAGYIQGNPNIARGQAKIIVNEVTSTNPTALNGFLEVAGGRASVVIANPNGIAVNGGGFINTAQAMLTTGKPVYDSSNNLSRLHITGGTVSINGNGLDASQTDSVDILARAVEVNAGVWANQANVITGANDVNYADLKATAIAGQGEQPAVALDVAAIGGMYANKITLVGTEKGLGVNVAGTVSATQALALDNDGSLHITKTGAMYSDDTLSVHTTGNVLNEQTLASGGNAVIHAEQGLTNTAVVGAGVSRDGKIDKTGTLTLHAPVITNDNAQIVSGGNMTVAADSISSKSGEFSSQANASLTVTNDLITDEGKVTAVGNLTIDAGAMPLTGIIASGGDTSITTRDSLTNESSADGFGTIKADGNITLTTDGSLTNIRDIESGKTLTVHAAAAVTNKETGTLNGNDVAITTGDVDNTGLITANAAASITASHIKNHENGRIYGDDITLTADTIENRQNTELEEQLAAAMAVLAEKEQALDDAYRADVTKYTNASQEQQYKDAIAAASKAYDDQLAVVQGIQEDMATHKSGSIAARNTLTITGAKSVLNSSGALLYSGGDMTITAGDTITNRGATIDSMGNLSLTASQVSNENDAFSAKRVGGDWVNNPEKIRIDQAGHSEQGQAFDRSEFSNLSSGYGAYHHPNAMEIYEPAYDIVEEPGPGETADPAYPVGSKIANYDWDDPIFETFGLSPMTSARPEEAGVAQTDWDTRFNALLEQLQTKITEHNAEAEKHNAALGIADSQKIDPYTIIRTHSQTSENVVQSTNAGVIRSGADMTINGDLRNENSQMAAGNTMTATGKVENVAKENQELTVTFGTTQGSYTYKRSWPHKSRRRKYNDEVFMTPQVEEGNTSPMNVSSFEDHSDNAPAGQDITQEARDDANKFLDPFTIDTSGSTATPGQWQDASRNLTSSLYNLNPDTTAKYLIETDPAFTSKHNFLSSDYMYEQMKWDPERVPKRLGDGFYEQQLIRDQILNQTGQRYLDGYSSDMEEYKALMDAGIAYAKETGLVPGVSLSPEQVAALTSDMVWLETKTVMVNGEPQEVVYPRVYLRANSNMTLSADGSLLSAKNLVIDTKEAVENSGVLQGKTVQIQAGLVQNTGRIQGGAIGIQSESDIYQGGLMTAADSVQLSAQHDVVMENTVTHLANQDVLNRTAGIAVTGDDGVLLVEAGHNIDLAGATLQALGDNGAVILNAGNDVNLTTQTLSAKKDMTLNSDNYLRTQRQTEVGTSIDAKGGVAVQAGQDINARAAYINSDDGTVAMAAGRDINLTTGREIAVDDFGLKHKESGLLSSSTTTIRTHDDHQTVLGTTITGKEVQMGAVQDVNMTAAAVAGQNDVTVAAGRNVTTTSDMQYDKATAYTKVKSSGVLGAGLGIMIGTQKMQDNYEGEFKTQIGTTIGSSEGSVTIAAGDTAHLTTTDIIGKTGIDIAAQDIILDGKQNEAHERQTHEESLSGLTISLSSPVIEAAEGMRSTIRTAQTRDNKTLQALEAYEGGKTLNDQIHAMEQGGIGSVGIHVGIGSSSFKQEYQNDTVTYAGGTLASEGNITIAAGSEDTAKGNINAIGETIQGQNVTLAASHDIDLGAGTNTQTITDNYSSKGSSLGMTITGGAISGVDASFSKVKDEGTTETTTHTGTTVTASDTLTMQSGNDTTITGSQVGGKTVKVDVGGNLNISSLQDTETYRGDSSSMGGGISVSMSSGSKKDWLDDSFRKYDSTPYVPGTTGGSAFLGKGSMDSDYASVTQQAGIYAGEGGFTVHVEDNTRLTGSLLDSTASEDKNSLTTGTLTMEDMGNKAEYDVKNIGVSYHHYGSEAARQDNFNQSGLTPSISPGAQDEASSATQSAIAPGTIITTKEQTDLSQINRNTADALHKLDQIFDKKDIQERQELAQLFSKNANELLHQYDRDGTFDKALAHGIVAEISSQIAGNGAGSGFAAGFTNELLIDKIKEWSGGDPAKAQWISAALGATVNEATGNAAESGASSAQDGTKWNAEAIPWTGSLGIGSGISLSGSEVLQFIKGGTLIGLILSGEQVAGGDSPNSITADGGSWGNYAETVTNAPAYNETSGTGETSSVETAVTSHYETNDLGVRVLVSSDGTYYPTNTFEKDGVIYTIAGIDEFYQIYGVDENGKTAYLDKQYYIGDGRTATSTGKRDEFGHLIGIANDTGEEVKLNDWLLPNGIHAWYERDNAKTGEIIVTDGIGEYTTTQTRNPNISSGLPEGSMMPPNNTPNPSDLADLLLQSQQQNNQNDYSNDTSYLYTKNVSKALLEQTLNRIGGKYGASHLGTAAITGSGALNDYLQGKSAEEILWNSILSYGSGKVGQKVGENTGSNPSFNSALFSALADTISDKKEAEKNKENVDFNK